MTNDEMYRVLERIGIRIRQRWIDAVSGTVLTGMSYPFSSSSYAGSITGPYRTGPLTVRVSASWGFARRVEQGHPAIDLKSYLLRSPKAKTGKHGSYLDVAFLWQDQHGNGEGQALPNVSAGDIAGTTGNTIARRSARRRTSTLSPQALRQLTRASRGGALQWGRRSQLGKAGVQAAFGSGSVPAYTQQFGHLVGMRPRGAGRAGGVTFRRVSTKSAPGSWVLPSRPPNLIRASVVRDVLL